MMQKWSNFGSNFTSRDPEVLFLKIKKMAIAIMCRNYVFLIKNRLLYIAFEEFSSVKVFSSPPRVDLRTLASLVL